MIKLILQRLVQMVLIMLVVSLVLFAVFDSPTRAARCALALLAMTRSHGLRLRAGIHTGEYQEVGPDVRGLAVHIAARVMATACADELRASSAAAALLDASSLDVRPLGPHDLKGAPVPIELFAVGPSPR